MLTYGATCHFIVPELDAGNQIINQSTFTVPPGMSEQEMAQAAAGKQVHETDFYFVISLPTAPLVATTTTTDTTAASGSTSSSTGTATQGTTP